VAPSDVDSLMTQFLEVRLAQLAQRCGADGQTLENDAASGVAVPENGVDGAKLAA
jgi:hypothetical protein